jgi:hypothetical protein
MRVATEHRVVAAAPGTTIEVVVDVVNTGDRIDGVTARLVGLGDAPVRVEPQVLPLFPGATGQLTVTADVPTSQPAGLHALSVEVVSHVSGDTTEHLDLDLSVSARPAVHLSRSPAVVRARRQGRFVLLVGNTGNTALDVELTPSTADRATTAVCSPASLTVEPGTNVPVMLRVRGPRMLTGGEMERQVTVDLVARRSLTIPAMLEDEADTGADLAEQGIVTLRQRPLISRGLLTALVLAGIVALWAAVFLLGLSHVFSGDPVTKTAPASFFPVAASTDPSGTGGADGGGDGDGAPAGATPKTGLLAPGVGGTISGTVTAGSNAGPVGRILVQAYRMGREGPVLVSSAATQSDGTYTLAGLFPTTYWLKFSADGFGTVWSPSKPATRPGDGAQPAVLRGEDGSSTDSVTLAAADSGLAVQAKGKIEGANATVSGKAASISGTVDPGDSLEPALTTVVARMLDATAGTTVKPVRATTDASGAYHLGGLVAPGRYELSFSTDGYAVTTQVETVTGGEDRLEPTVLLSARTGALTGTVSDKDGPLGGVTVSTTVNGAEVTVITPTVGSVGTFTLDDLPTPGTYVLTFSAPGHGSATRVVDLAAGQDGSADVALAAGTGTVSGILLGPNGKGLGGATVTVGGASNGTSSSTGTGTEGGDGTDGAVTTTTLTSGSVGAFTISGLTAPGSYTLTFTSPGYRPETVPVQLSGNEPPAAVTAQLRTQLGRITGKVTGPSGAYAGATVTATNGVSTYRTTSSSAGGALASGGYLLTGLEPGVYSVTVTASGMTQQTAQVTVTGGRKTTQDLTVTAAE